MRPTSDTLPALTSGLTGTVPADRRYDVELSPGNPSPVRLSRPLSDALVADATAITVSLVETGEEAVCRVGWTKRKASERLEVEALPACGSPAERSINEAMAPAPWRAYDSNYFVTISPQSVLTSALMEPLRR